MQWRMKTAYDSFQAEISKCPKCGRLFISHRKDQKYYPSTCRKQARRQQLNTDSKNKYLPSRYKRVLCRRMRPRSLTQEDFEELADVALV